MTNRGNSETEDDDEIDTNNNNHENIDASSDQQVPQDQTRQDHPGAGRRRHQSPVDILDRYLAVFDPNNIYSIPEASQTIDEDFTVNHLQGNGLLNDANICSLLSVFLCFHRIGLKDHLLDPEYCITVTRAPDFPSWVIMKILSALPSQHPFSLQLFIESWNHSNKRPIIHPGFADIPSLAECLVSNLQVKQYANKPPVFTQFLATFCCNKCGKDHVKVKNWDEQVQASIPLLQIPATSQPVDILDLLDSYVNERFQTRCSNIACRNRVFDAKLEVELGLFTVLAISRFIGGRAKLKNKLIIRREAQQLLDVGELVSLVCHRGDVNVGHFVSYHKVGEQWFLNDDSRRCAPSNNPVEDRYVESETVDLLFFKRNIQ